MSIWTPSVPVAPPPMARPRLLSRLDAGTPLTVVRAPSGFGKTTLIRHWLDRLSLQDAAVATVRVRPGGETDGFWLAVVDALTDAGLQLPLLAERRPPHSTAERMLSAAREPLLLWIDNFENVPGERVDETLLDVVASSPHLRLVVCLRNTRQFPVDSDVDLLATRIDARELLFTAAETTQVLAEHDLSASDVEAIQTETGGWAHPIKALAVALRRDAANVGGVRAVAAAVTADYLRSRLLPSAANEERADVALVTSLPDQFSAELAESLTGDPAAGTHLEWLVGQGLLGIDSSDGEVMYRWPDGARRALAAELNRRAPGRLPDLETRLANWYVDQDQPAFALQHAVRAGDWSLAVRVVHASWRQLLFHHRHELYDAVVRTPLDVIISSPRTIAMRAMFLQVVDDHLLSLPDLPATPAELAALGTSAAATDHLDTGLATLIALRDRGQFDLAVEHGERLLQVAAAARAAQPGQVAHLYAAVQFFVGQVRLAAGSAIPSAIQCFTEAYARAGDSPMGYLEADAAGKLAMTHAADGSAHEAAVWLERWDAAPVPDTWLLPMMRISPATARLLIAVDTLDLTAASKAAGALAGGVYRDHFWALHLYARSLLALHGGTALDMLAELERARSERPEWVDAAGAVPLLAAAEADLLLALGRGNQARAILLGPHEQHPLLQLGRARLALLSDQPAAAVRLATDAGWQRVAITRHRQEMWLVHAVAAERLGDRATAVKLLAGAVDAASATGVWRPFTTVPRRELSAIAADLPDATDVLDRAPVVRVADAFPDQVGVVDLTRREQDVLERIVAGLSMHQVANALRVSYSTVRTQQRSLYRKLAVESQPDAVAKARQLGLLSQSQG